MAALPDVVPNERTGHSTNTLGLQIYTFAFGATSDLGDASRVRWAGCCQSAQ